VDVGAWLRRLGLEQYERAFRDNAVDSELRAALSLMDLGLADGDARERVGRLRAGVSDGFELPDPQAATALVPIPLADAR
jgi:hypothetical protein